MPEFDMPLAELERYSPSIERPSNFDSFWRSTLDEAAQHPLDVRLDPVDNRLALVDTWDLQFSGFGGHRIHAWLHLPAGTSGRLPTVVEYPGYSGARGLPHQGLLYALAGYAHIVLDSRGQGWATVGATPDPTPDAGATTVPGLLTKGIHSPETHYHRRLYTDAARLMDAVRTLEMVDPNRVVALGHSQGGAVAIAATALSSGVAGLVCNVPFMSHFERAVRITDAGPYSEITTYLARYRDHQQVVFETLSYFDTVNFVSTIECPSIWSVALRDDVAPPSTVYAAYNACASTAKIMSVYPFNAHEGGGEHHDVATLTWLADLFRTPSVG